METLTLPGIDEQTFASLRDQARRQGKTVEEEAIDIIRQGVGKPTKKIARDVDALVAEARRIRAMTPKGVAQTDSVEIIREMREERMRDLGC